MGSRHRRCRTTGTVDRSRLLLSGDVAVKRHRAAGNDLAHLIVSFAGAVSSTRHTACHPASRFFQPTGPRRPLGRRLGHGPRCRATRLRTPNSLRVRRAVGVRPTRRVVYAHGRRVLPRGSRLKGSSTRMDVETSAPIASPVLQGTRVTYPGHFRYLLRLPTRQRVQGDGFRRRRRPYRLL